MTFAARTKAARKQRGISSRGGHRSRHAHLCRECDRLPFRLPCARIDNEVRPPRETPRCVPSLALGLPAVQEHPWPVPNESARGCSSGHNSRRSDRHAVREARSRDPNTRGARNPRTAPHTHSAKAREGQSEPRPDPCDPALEFGSIDRIPIADQVPKGRLPGKRLDHLLCRPRRRGMSACVDVQKPAALQTQHNEHVEQPEADGGHHGEVDGDRFPKVVSQERPPALRGRLPMPRHVRGDRRLCDRKPELEQLAADPGAPQVGFAR